MVAAPIAPGQEGPLRALLASMNLNGHPGLADPANALVPFGEFRTLHFARFVILNDTTLDDLKAFGREAEFPDAPTYLAFFGDCDGSASTLLAGFAYRAGAGLRQIFAHCAGFHPRADLLQWMRDHSVKPAAAYVNWIGRTVRQIHEEAALHEALSKYLANLSIDNSIMGRPRQIRNELISIVSEKGPPLTAPAPTPITWLARRLLYCLAVVLAAYVVLLPLLKLTFVGALLVYGTAALIAIAAAICFLIQLRWHETTDPQIRTPPTNAHLLSLGVLQDQDVTNQYSLIGQVKPGLFARWTTTVIFWLINLASPILYPRGNLARIKTIHSARWVFLDNKRRVLFASNYDGSAESYMDDFVNKVAFGLNLAFSQGVSFPPTWFLLWRGANYEQTFKNVQRRHSLPTEVWYKAYPGLSLIDITWNARIRQGLERGSMSDAEIRQWLAEI